MRKRGKYEAIPTSRSVSTAGSRHLQVLISSIVSLVLCCSMLLGTTMAWFTDTVTSSTNRITIGKLKVDVTYHNQSLRNTSVPVFGGEEDEVWIPDESRIKTLTVHNNGNLDLNYSLTFLTKETISKEAFQLFHVYSVKVNAGEATPSIGDMKKDENYRGTLYDILINKSPVFSGSLKAGTDDQSTQETFAIALYMDSSANGDNIQGASLTLNVQLHAYQSNAPEDEVGVAEANDANTAGENDEADPAEGDEADNAEKTE